MIRRSANLFLDEFFTLKERNRLQKSQKTIIDWPQYLRDFRLSRSLKQETAAAMLGVTQPTLSRWETGASTPTTAAQNKVLKLLRQEKTPLESLEWVQVFRRWLGGGTIETKDGILRYTTRLAEEVLKTPREAIEGARIRDWFVGEAIEQRERTTRLGFYDGMIASFEACFHVEMRAHIRRDVSFYLHSVAWPYVLQSGEIIKVCQCRTVERDEAEIIRDRLDGPAQYTFVR